MPLSTCIWAWVAPVGIKPLNLAVILLALYSTITVLLYAVCPFLRIEDYI